MFNLGSFVFLTAVLQARGDPNSSEPVNATAEDITLDETDDTVYAFVWTVGGVLLLGTCLFLTFLLCKRNERRQKRLEDETEGDVKEWYYIRDGVQLGPFTAYSMRVQFRLQESDVDRDTLVKVVWQAECVPVSALFPDAGTEFNMAPAMTNEDAHTDWHRHSVLARPSGRPPPAISWFYKVNDHLYGPFEMGKMRHWFLEKKLPADTIVRPGDPQGPFKPISEFYPDLEKAFDGIPLIPEGMSAEALPDAPDRGSQMARGSFYQPGSGSGLAFPPDAAGTPQARVSFTPQGAPQMVGRPEDVGVTELAAPPAKKKKKKAAEGEESGEAPKKKKGTKKKKPREDESAPLEAVDDSVD